MRGISRASLAQVAERLAPLTASPEAATTLGNELLAVAGLLASQPALRRALADPSRTSAARSGLATSILSGKVSDAAAGLVGAVAEQEGRLDNLEDELFRFGRIVASTPELRIALTNPFVGAAAKRELLSGLLSGKVTPEALRLISEAAASPLGRSLDVSLEEYARLAAQRRERLVAEVHVASALTEAQRERLAAALAVAYGHQVHLNVVLDPRVAGGMTIRVGDELIDGSTATRLGAARRGLVA
jgi:F-type H+-transporting ATPase subunit delta